MPSLHIPYTLSLMANIGRDAALNTIKRGFICEFDCTLDVDYSDAAEWEITSVTFEQTRWNDEFYVSEKSDHQLWALVLRAIDYDWKDLGDKVRECIIEDDSNAQFDSAKHYSDVSMGR